MDEEEEIEGVPGLFHRHPLLLCFLLFLAFVYALVYPVFAFILASAPVLILTALLLGLVLLNGVPQDHDPHVYKKISHRPPQYQPTAAGPPSEESPPTSDSSSSSSADDDNYNRPAMSTATSHASFPDTAANTESESTDSDHEQDKHQRSEKKEAVRAVAWTADDDKSIENIGSLELEMNATVEKLMSRRRARGHQRPLHHHHHHVMDVDDPSKLSIATRKSNPFDLDGPYDEDDNFPDSAPSMLGLRPSRNPFFDDMDDDLHLQAPPQPSSNPGAGAGAAAAQKNAMLFRRHESFTVGAPYVSDFRPSRFRPYFVTEKMQGQPVSVPEASRKSSSSSTSSSSGANAYAYAYASANKEEEAAAEQEAVAEAAAAMLEEVKTEEYSSRSREVVAVDVELISDSSDDDMTLPPGGKEQQQQQVAEQDQQQMKMEQEQEQRMKQQQAAEQEQRMKQQQQAAEQEQQMKMQQQVAEQEQQMKMMQQQQQQQQQLELSDDDDEGDSFEVESITKQVDAAAAAGKTKQLEADPAYDYSPSAPTVKTEKKQQQQQEAAAFAQLPPTAPNKLQSMRRVFSEEDADEPWAAPSALEETGNEDMFPLPPLPESAPSAGGAPPLSAAAKKAIGKSTKYKPPTKKAVLGFFRK